MDRKFLAYRVKCLARQDKQIPYDLYTACQLAGMNPEEIYDNAVEDLKAEDIDLDDPELYFDCSPIEDPLDRVIRMNTSMPCQFYDEEE